VNRRGVACASDDAGSPCHYVDNASMGVVLIGYRGSGKTTVGQKLAKRLGRSFVDADDLIVAMAGKTIKEIFEQDGEPVFRDHESAILREVVSRLDHVLSLGGGALERAENRRLFSAGGHRVIYLRCDADELLRRIQSDTLTAAMRPALTGLGGGIEEINALLARREPVYRSVMTDEIDVTHLSPSQVVDRIIGLS
jgi:shikimate kinase